MILTCFSLAHQLAEVHAPIYVDEGIIFHGGITALVPVERRADKIVWHFEGRLDDFLPVSEIKAVKNKWYQTLNLNELQSAPVLLGWSKRGSLVLGTEQAPRHVPWPSEARNAHLMKLSKPTIQGSVKMLAHLSIAASATIASVDVDIIHTLPENYARQLLCTKKPWIAYDDVQRRAWLVPQISLIHHMLVLSQADLELTLPPFALPSTTGEESLRVLLEHASYVLYHYGHQKFLLSELVVEFIERLYRVSPIPTLTHGEIVGYDLMEVLSGLRKQTPKTINPDPRPSWMRLLSHVPCLIASNAGELMISERSPAPGKNYLTATVNMLTDISHNTTANAWKVPNGYWSAKSSRDFDSCLRSNGTDSC